MALPVTLLVVGSDLVALPILIGVALEVVRSAVRRRLKRRIRRHFMDQTARQALDKRALVPEADVESAFWAAHLFEYAITTDAPALIAASLAGAGILTLAIPALGASVVGALLGLLLATVCLMITTNRWRTPAIDAVVEHRQRVAAWVATAERDSGEIYGARARDPFLVQLRVNVDDWSSAEERLEIGRLQQRLAIAALFSIAVIALFHYQHVDAFHVQAAGGLSAHDASGLLLLSSGVPACYVFATHADSLLTSYASLKQLLSSSVIAQGRVQALARRPETLVARGLRYAYPGSTAGLGPRPLDFTVDLRKLTLIVAPNGAGKTTLARLICGVLTRDSGALEIDGIPCSEVSRDDFGFVPQNPLIIEALTIEQNVHLVSPGASAEAIARLLLELGLTHPLQTSAGQISRGEQRRVAIARAILKEPRLLLLDEPDVWLDTRGRAALAHVLEQQIEQRAVVVVSHRSDWLPRASQVIDLERQATDLGTNNA